jgi:RNA-directed DNA polymerase
MNTMFAAITSWDNLLLAAHKAAHGKRRTLAAATFERTFADNLLRLRQQLLNRTYTPGGYANFVIHEPKRRKISAAPFRDRVVHHALCNVIEPIFDAHFIPNSFANRTGKGTHAAIQQLQQFAQRYRYVLRADVVEHFPSLDHAVLRNEIVRVIDDEGVRGLIDVILDSGAGVLRQEYTPVCFSGDTLFDITRPRGLPIGNLTSQFWSNVYMNPFDWFVQRELGCTAYLRYVDDFALFSNSKRQLAEWRAASIERLALLRLTLHENEAQALPTHCGIPWLGFVVYPTHKRLKRRNAVAFTHRLSQNIALYRAGQISFGELDASVQGWIAHVDFGDTWGLRDHVFSQFPI